MNIVDLRQTTVRQLESLLEEESRHWRKELHWDYRGALELIKRFLEARALAGSVAFENGNAAGYSGPAPISDAVSPRAHRPCAYLETIHIPIPN